PGDTAIHSNSLLNKSGIGPRRADPSFPRSRREATNHDLALEMFSSAVSIAVDRGTSPAIRRTFADIYRRSGALSIPVRVGSLTSAHFRPSTGEIGIRAAGTTIRFVQGMSPRPIASPRL